MVIPYKAIALLIVGVLFFARGAKMDGKSPLLWGSLSLLAWIVTYFVLGGGIGIWALGQLALFAGLFAWNLRAERKREKGGGAS